MSFQKFKYRIRTYVFSFAKIFLILLFVIAVSCSPKNKKAVIPDEKTVMELPQMDNNLTLDSISIEDSYADNPFPFPDDSMTVKYFIKYITKPVEEVSKETYNLHDIQSVDTLITIKWENSRVDFYRSSYTKRELIEYADIYDAAFIFKEGVKIGMSLEEVKSKFAILRNDNKNYKYIEFYYGDATNYTVLFFEDGKLKSVRYMPYTG